MFCCAELRSASRSAQSAAAALAAASSAADSSPSPSTANLDSKHSAAKASVPDTSNDAELAWKQQLLEACQYDNPEPDDTDFGVEDSDQTDDDFNLRSRSRSRSSSRQRDKRARSQSPAQSAAARNNSKEDKMTGTALCVVFSPSTDSLVQLMC